MKSKLLFDKYPLIINPSLAALIGLNEAIILQQIHYWLIHNEESEKNYYEERYWTYNTYEEWKCQFPFWSVSTIQRTIKRLEIKGFVISSNFNSYKLDRTKWYSIDYEAIDQLISMIWQPLSDGKKLLYSWYQNDEMQSVVVAGAIGQSDQSNTRD